MNIVDKYYKCVDEFTADNGFIIDRKCTTVKVGELYRVTSINAKNIRLRNSNGELEMSLLFFIEHFYPAS